MHDIYAQPLSFESLQQFKALAPLTAGSLAELAQIEKLDISDFNETEFRSNVIDPIVRILGYRKGTNFSVDLGRQIEILEKSRFPDYKFNLWEADFWLIEAKRPRHGQANFGYEDLAQALEYAAHPQINAALVVLCDGLKIEVFDRELQVWFFQKRRVIRLLDKVFDREFNLNRVEEFKWLVEGRLNSKRQVILENFRRNQKPDTEEQKELLLKAPIEDLAEVHLFLPQLNAMTSALAKHSEAGSFRTLYKIFPNQPRDANDTFYAQALNYLIEFAAKRETIECLPAWLAPGQQSNSRVELAVQRLLRLCLTHFREDEARKTILLASAAFRLVVKVLLTPLLARPIGLSTNAEANVANSKPRSQSFNSSRFGNSRRPSSGRLIIIQNCGPSLISARCIRPNRQFHRLPQ